MSMITHSVVLHGDTSFHGKLPTLHLGYLLTEIPLAVRDTVSMALRSRSRIAGRRPAWLERAADVRFVGHHGNDTTTLILEAPPLGEAAPEIFAHPPLLPEQRPDPNDTGLDLVGDLLIDLDSWSFDSPYVDAPLLKRLGRFGRFFEDNSPYTQIDLVTRRHFGANRARVTRDIAQAADKLRGQTPSPRRVRVVGILDCLEASTQRFSVLLESGEKAFGAFSAEQAEAIHRLWRKRVLVVGTAIFRVSGKLLRIDAEVVAPGENESSLFSRLPSAVDRRSRIEKFRQAQGPRSGVGAIVGQWPGDETDEEIDAILKELS